MWNQFPADQIWTEAAATVPTRGQAYPTGMEGRGTTDPYYDVEMPLNKMVRRMSLLTSGVRSRSILFCEEERLSLREACAPDLYTFLEQFVDDF